jgi:mannose-6-phosphate isomerase-like protein (cupin superfamily)
MSPGPPFIFFSMADQRRFGEPSDLDGLFASQLAAGMVRSPEGGVAIAEWTDPGGGSDPPTFVAPLHIHLDDDEAWYVLEGTLMIRLAGQDVEVPPGGAVIAPRGTPHTYWNPRPQPARYLLISTSTINDLIEALRSSAERTDAVTATFARYRSVYLGWP